MHLQRFTVVNGHVSKNNAAVSCDEYLDLSLLSGEQLRYRLLAILVHHGREATSGHYTAHVSDGTGYIHCDDLTRGSRWQKLSQLVSIIDKSMYMLFYVRA